MSKLKIAILASGNGTNAENIINYFERSTKVEVLLVAANCPTAYVLTRAREHSVQTYVFTKEEMQSEQFLNVLDPGKIDLIVLAGFLLKIPEYLIDSFRNRIINIHPALLPKYGGKGMYGGHVHATVIANKEKESGITIHLVNSNYDEGKILFQVSCLVEQADTPEILAKRIHKLEHENFPKIIEQYLDNL
jgi:phosphoribosylglycinamide formyltransferase-1